jgi:hypothetical protein
MKRPPTLCGLRADPCLRVHCILCGLPVEGADLEHAWVRTVDEEIPPVEEFAHAGCAFAAGFYDEPDPEEERPR